MDLFQLETFVAVAEERSFSRAAARLHRTQPAVSQVIAKLEAELGEVLLERAAGQPTDAGYVLLEYAQKMLSLRKDAGSALVDLRSLHRGRLDLAANEYTCLYLLPVLDAFRHKHPRIKVAVQRTLASRIADQVQSREVEIGVVSFRPADPQVVSTVVYRDELMCVVSPTHALAKAGKAALSRLGRETFVAHNVPSPLRQRVIETFQRRNIPLQMEVELPSLEAIKRFVQRGNGVAMVPRLTVEGELEAGMLVAVEVPELQIERKLRLVHRRGTALSHAAREFLAVVRTHAQEHGDPFCFVSEGRT
ncbi:MAG: LysR family transcriptional regulator [Acidobacteriaceae bacterium]